MKYVMALAIALLGIQPAYAAEPPVSAWCYGYVFAFWTPKVALEPVIEGIVAEAATGNQGSLDVAAEFLLQHLDDTQLSHDNAKDVLALLARTRSGRYRLVMEKVRASKRPAAFKNVARGYLNDSKASVVSQYTPGTVNFAALREQYIQQALSAKPTDERARQLDSMNPGDSLEKLIALLGPPQHVATGFFLFGKNMSVRRLILHYRGAGRAVFALDDRTGWGFQAAVADPLAFEMLMPYRGRAPDFGLPNDDSIRMAQLASGHLPAIRAAVEGAYRQPKVPLEFLDASAEWLAKSWPDAKDDIVEDTCAWVLRLLRMKGGARYASLFEEIATNTHSLLLRKWAKMTLLRYPGYPNTGYVVGAVPLAEVARRYPSPYPEVTYSNGRL